MRHDDPHIRNRVSDPTYSEKLEIAAKERAHRQELERMKPAAIQRAWESFYEERRQRPTADDESLWRGAFIRYITANPEQTAVDVRTEARDDVAEVDERWPDFLKRMVAEQQPVDLIGQLEARLDAIEKRLDRQSIRNGLGI